MKQPGTLKALSLRKETLRNIDSEGQHSIQGGISLPIATLTPAVSGGTVPTMIFCGVTLVGGAAVSVLTGYGIYKSVQALSVARCA